jgi:hypothetical protein
LGRSVPLRHPHFANACTRVRCHGIEPRQPVRAGGLQPPSSPSSTPQKSRAPQENRAPKRRKPPPGFLGAASKSSKLNDYCSPLGHLQALGIDHEQAPAERGGWLGRTPRLFDVTSMPG